MELRKRTALVTGAASGIGRSIAERFAREGARVVFHDVATSVVPIADACGQPAVQADLSDPQAVRDVARRALELCGGRVDILVNNAGFQSIHPVEDFPEERWMQMIQVMLVAPFQLIKHTLPAMKANRWGRIINISSLHGVVASPYKSAYISAKHGIIGLTKTVALEVGEFGVTANAICPAYVRTAIVDKQIADQAKTQGIDESEVVERIMLGPAAIKRLIEPEEIAEFALYLATDKAAVITGASHMLDLGWTAR